MHCGLNAKVMNFGHVNIATVAYYEITIIRAYSNEIQYDDQVITLKTYLNNFDCTETMSFSRFPTLET